MKKRYLTNVIWSWTAVGINMILAFLLAPYIIRKIGTTDYGAWLLAMTLVEYYWLIDLGLRSATVKMSAEYRALGETSGLETLLSTAVLYSGFAGALLAIVTLLVAPQAGRLFKINHPAFATLVMVVGVSWAIGMLFNPFSAATEGYQRFDVFSRIWMVTSLTRAAGTVAVLHMGRGILEMGLVLFAGQLLMYAMTYIAFRRVVTGVQLSWRKSSWPMFVRMARYGIHTFTASLATRLMSQSIPPLIAYLLPLRFVTYYGVPVRMLDYGMEGIGRVGQVTMPNASDLMARGQRAELLKLGILANRYSLASIRAGHGLSGRVWIRSVQLVDPAVVRGRERLSVAGAADRLHGDGGSIQFGVHLVRHRAAQIIRAAADCRGVGGAGGGGRGAATRGPVRSGVGHVHGHAGKPRRGGVPVGFAGIGHTPTALRGQNLRPTAGQRRGGHGLAVDPTAAVAARTQLGRVDSGQPADVRALRSADLALQPGRGAPRHGGGPGAEAVGPVSKTGTGSTVPRSARDSAACPGFAPQIHPRT